MFYIVDFKYSNQQTDLTTSKFNHASQIIEFVAEKSTEFEEFEIERISRYDNVKGKLIPCELSFSKGRIELVEEE